MLFKRLGLLVNLPLDPVDQEAVQLAMTAIKYGKLVTVILCGMAEGFGFCNWECWMALLKLVPLFFK